MEHLIFVESTKMLEKFTGIIPADFKLLSLDQIFKFGTHKVIEDVLSQEDMNIISDLIKNSSTIHIVFSETYFKIQSMYAKLIHKFSIKQFNRVELDNLEHINIQIAFNNARVVDHDEINFMLAKDKIDHIVGVDINNLLKWFLRKNNILNVESIDKIHLSRLTLYALEVIVSNQDKIDNFIGETYEKIGIDYSYGTKQFRVKNNKKFKKDMQEELMLMYNQTIDSTNYNVIEKFDRDIKNIPAPEPLTKNSLQKTASFIFAYTPRETMKIAKELFNGVMINSEKISLITSVNTSSTRIDKEKRILIKDFIEKLHGEDFYFNGEKGDKKKSVEHETKEAIVPKFYSDEYLPNKIKSFLTEDQFKIYNYIFWRTITSQMTNATRDDSNIIVNVGGNKFKAVANKILFEGWIKEGKIWDPELDINGEIVDIPEDLYVGMELDRYRIEVIIYPVSERTPMRYSTGRFFDKTSKEVTAEENEITFLLDNLLEQDLIKIGLKSMIEPSEKGKRIYYILKEFVPSIIDKDFVIQTQIGLKAVKEGKFDKESLIHEYQKELSLLRDNLGFKGSDGSEDWKKEEAKKIAKENNQNLPDYILENKVLLNEYILKNDKKIEKLGICPHCKKGEIYAQSKGFSCNNSDCSFVVWKTNIARFFDNFGKTVNENSYRDYIKVILSKGQILIDNLFYNEKFFDREVCIEFNEKFKSWGFGFVKKNIVPQIKIEEINEEEIIEEKEIKDNELEINEEIIDSKIVGNGVYIAFNDIYVFDDEIVERFINKEKEDQSYKEHLVIENRIILIIGREENSMIGEVHFEKIKKRVTSYFGAGNFITGWTMINEQISSFKNRSIEEIKTQKELPAFSRRIKY